VIVTYYNFHKIISFLIFNLFQSSTQPQIKIADRKYIVDD